MNSKSQSTSEYPTASFWKRLFSTLYDIFILGAISLAYFAVVTALSANETVAIEKNYLPTSTGLAVQAGWVLTLLGFYCFFWYRIGQTVAMKAWRLKVVSKDGNRLAATQCIIRAALGFLGFALCGISYLWIFFDKDKRALHDRLSKTFVIQLPKGE